MSVKESIVLIGPAIALMIGCSAAPRAIDWRWGPVLPEARSARATTGVGDMAVTVGGTSWKTVDGGKVKRWRRSVYALDPDAGWSMLPAYPHDAGYAAACAIDRRLIVVGGKDADRGHRETYVLDLDAAEPRWTPGPQLPRARWGHVGGVIGSTVYVTGGFESTPEGKGAPAASVLAWDTVSDDGDWQRVSVMPRSDLEWPMGAVCADRLYVFGGSASGVPVDVALAFDPATGGWEERRAMPVALSSGAATAIGARYVLVSGGSSLAVTAADAPDGKPRTPIESACLLYDTRTDTYRVLTPLRQPVLDQGLVVLNGTLFSIGGEETPHKTRTDLVQIGSLR